MMQQIFFKQSRYRQPSLLLASPSSCLSPHQTHIYQADYGPVSSEESGQGWTYVMFLDAFCIDPSTLYIDRHSSVTLLWWFQLDSTGSTIARLFTEKKQLTETIYKNKNETSRLSSIYALHLAHPWQWPTWRSLGSQKFWLSSMQFTLQFWNFFGVRPPKSGQLSLRHQKALIVARRHVDTRQNRFSGVCCIAGLTE